jgi:hypothetical protein
MSATKTPEVPEEVVEMRLQLAAARRAARGVKDSARNLRAAPKSDRYAQLTDPSMRDFDSKHPPAPNDDTTRRQVP